MPCEQFLKKLKFPVLFSVRNRLGGRKMRKILICCRNCSQGSCSYFDFPQVIFWILKHYIWPNMKYINFWRMTPCLWARLSFKERKPSASSNLKDILEKSQNSNFFLLRSRIGASSSIEGSMKQFLRRFDLNQNKWKSMTFFMVLHLKPIPLLP